jgi:hypothetical protein
VATVPGKAQRMLIGWSINAEKKSLYWKYKTKLNFSKPFSQMVGIKEKGARKGIGEITFEDSA